MQPLRSIERRSLPSIAACGAILLGGVVSCSPTASPGSGDASESSSPEATADSNDSNSTGSSGTDELPDGCGDANVVSGQYCFRFVPLPLAAGTEIASDSLAWAVDLDIDGVAEAGVKTRTVDGLKALELFEVHTTEVRKVGQVIDFRGKQFNDWQFAQVDWDGDGDRDLVTVTNGIPKVRPYLQHERGTFSAGPSADLGDWSKGGPFPFNPTRIGGVSLLVGHDDGLQIYRSLDAVAWSPWGDRIEIINVCNDVYFALEHDIDGDGRPDVLALGSNAGCDPYLFGEYDANLHTLAVLRGRADGGLDPPVYVPTGAPARSILAIADIDGDDIDDLVLDLDSNVGFAGYVILPGRGSGSFDTPQVYEFEPDSGGMLASIGDLDGDGDLDGLYFRFNEALLVADDIREPQYASLERTALSRPASLGDFNGDRVQDMIVFKSRPANADPMLVDGQPGLLLSAP